MINTQDNELADICLNMLPGIGPRKYNALIERFETSSAIFSASQKDLCSLKGIGKKIASLISHWHDYNPEEELKRCQLADIKILTRTHEDYPEALNHLPDAPICLYVYGNSQCLKDFNNNLAVVGTRRPTRYGLDMTKMICDAAAQAGFHIVSGLAVGIDTRAHLSSVEHNTPTIAVLGGGIGKLYPQQNLKLARSIAEKGAVISEYPLLFPPDRRTFPMRNRIIAGLSRGTLVVEADLNSGSLITADQSLEYGRDVFAVPGRIDYPQSRGCHKLLKLGATLVESFQDIHDEYNLLPGLHCTIQKKESIEKELIRKNDLQLSENEERILNFLNSGESHVDDISIATNIPSGKLFALLLGLETRKIVRLLPGKRYELLRI